MWSYTFRWEHPAEEVYVTGTFDKWSKSTLLEKSGSAHEKTVELPETGEKILYKFVADGSWSYDHTAKSEADDSGNLNNVLYPADLKHTSTSKSHSGPTSAAAAAISSVAPGAS
ncbi:Cruciform DNA binding protein [Oleoguttula sp. CCFEE 5521]